MLPMKEVKLRMKRNANKGEMDENIKYLVFGICVAFVLLCAFVGVSVASAATGNVGEWELVHAVGDEVVTPFYENTTHHLFCLIIRRR